MTDIVERLRASAATWIEQGGYSPNLHEDAADEIERLHRDRISGEAVITKLSFALKRDKTEIERLRAALEKITGGFVNEAIPDEDWHGLAVALQDIARSALRAHRGEGK